MKKLTLEEFAWRSRWIECSLSWKHGRLWNCGSQGYNLRKIRKLKRSAKQRDTPFPGKFGSNSKWAGMVRRWYAHYLQTGEL